MIHPTIFQDLHHERERDLVRRSERARLLREARMAAQELERERAMAAQTPVAPPESTLTDEEVDALASLITRDHGTGDRFSPQELRRLHFLRRRAGTRPQAEDSAPADPVDLCTTRGGS